MPIDVQKALSKIVTLPPVVLDGSLDAISSKSDLHRLIFCAALSPKPTRIRYHATLSADIRATIEVLCALGAEICEEPVDSSGVGMITVKRPLDAETAGRAATLDCGESGSTARFILPIACLFYVIGTIKRFLWNTQSFFNGFQPCALSSNSLLSRVTRMFPNSFFVMCPMSFTLSMFSIFERSPMGTVKRSS